MRTRSLLVLLAITLVAAFAVLNWPAFMAPTRLSLGFTSFDAPLGLAMLALLVLVILAFVIQMAMWQAAILTQTRRHAKELHAQRTLAEQAEGSRFTELRNLVHSEVERLAERISASQTGLRTEIRENSNSLAAMLGEIDDRMKRRDAGDPK